MVVLKLAFAEKHKVRLYHCYIITSLELYRRLPFHMIQILLSFSITGVSCNFLQGLVNTKNPNKDVVIRLNISLTSTLDQSIVAFKLC